MSTERGLFSSIQMLVKKKNHQTLEKQNNFQILKILLLISVPLYLVLIKTTGIPFDRVVAYVKKRRKENNFQV